MFGTITLGLAAYYTIGIGIKILKDNDSETKEAFIKVVKNSSSWPKDLYKKYKKD